MQVALFGGHYPRWNVQVLKWENIALLLPLEKSGLRDIKLIQWSTRI